MNMQLTLNINQEWGEAPWRKEYWKGMEVINECPQWWLVSSYGPGKDAWQRMINAVAETFSSEEGGVPTHLHFYCEFEKAQTLWEEMNAPETIETVSFGR